MGEETVETAKFKRENCHHPPACAFLRQIENPTLPHDFPIVSNRSSVQITVLLHVYHKAVWAVHHVMFLLWLLHKHLKCCPLSKGNQGFSIAFKADRISRWEYFMPLPCTLSICFWWLYRASLYLRGPGGLLWSNSGISDMLEVPPLLPEIYQTDPLVVCTHHCCLPSILDKDISEWKLLKVQNLNLYISFFQNLLYFSALTSAVFHTSALSFPLGI